MPKYTVTASLKFSALCRLVKNGNLPLATGCAADQNCLLTVQLHQSHLNWWPIDRKVWIPGSGRCRSSRRGREGAFADISFPIGAPVRMPCEDPRLGEATS